MKKVFLKQINKVILVILIISILSSIVSLKVFAENDTASFMINGSDSILNGIFTVTDKGTATISIKGILYTGSSNDFRNVDLNDEIIIALNANTNYTGSIRFDGNTLSDSYCQKNGQVATYTFTLSNLGFAAGNGKNMDIEFNDSQNPNPPTPPSQDIPVPNNAILLELNDNLGNSLSYNIYHNDTNLGVTIQYSYNKIEWFELSNYSADTNCTQALNNGTYTYAFENVENVYIKVTEVKGGILKSKALAGTQNGPSISPGVITNNKIYTLNTKNSVYDLEFDNGMYSVDWSYSKNEQADMRVDNGIVNIIKINDVDVSSENGNTANGGYWRIKAGDKVVAKIKPNYGYQFVSGGFNGSTMIAGANANTFEFTMPFTNLHFSALFQKVDNTINAKSEKVETGNIEISDNEIDTGTVELSVKDIELTEEQISNFKDAAKDYSISSYLDINLDQVIYKGIENEVWRNELKELNNPATVTLKLEDGVDGNEIVIVHEKHDGSYEIIPTTYNAETRTITFTTTSFSNYAIASKTTSNDENSIDDNNQTSNNPKTGDDVIIYGAIIVIAILGIITTNIVIKRNKQEK